MNVALVTVVGGSGPLVTKAYAIQLLRLAEGFHGGWIAAQRKYIDETYTGEMPPSYADIRDYLLYELESDELTSCRIALHLTRSDFFLSMGPLP